VAPESNLDKTLSVLFVEDDEITLEIQLSILTSKYPDITFYSAINGKLGLELFKSHTPDIVISDINMSEMCGVQMCSNIRSIKADTKLIAITGKSGGFFLHGSDDNEFEFDHVIVKPVDFQELFAVVDKCLDEIANTDSK